MADVGNEETSGEPWEFPSKPIGVRMAVIAAGPIMNFLFAFVALVFLFNAYGIETFDSTRVTPQDGSIAIERGIQRGDRIVTVDGKEVGDAHELVAALDEIAEHGAPVQIESDGATVFIDLPVAADGD